MSKILLVEDNPHIMKINAELLTMRGYTVYEADTVAACREILRQNPVDLVVLDILLPDGSGVELCREIKSQFEIPILFLSALGESRDVVEGLRAGGDDYLAKPYDLEVLLARIEARLRQISQGNRCLTCGPLRLDLRTGCGYLDDKNLLLTQKEFSALLLLARRAGRAVTKEELLREVWDSHLPEDSQSLWTLISRLRAKLCGDSRLEITSVRGVGYRLEQTKQL